MKRPRKLSGDRARRFCQALDADSAGRSQQPWWCAIATIARRIGMDGQEAIALADDLAKAGYVTHDQSQHTAADRRVAVRPHSVTLREAGRQLARGQKR